MKKQLVIGNAAIDAILAKEVAVEVRKHSIILDYHGNRIENRGSKEVLLFPETDQNLEFVVYDSSQGKFVPTKT